MLALVVGFAVASAAQDATAPPAPNKPATARAANPAADAQLYRNDTFGFRYKTPYGWVERTKEMNSGEMNGEEVNGQGDAQPKASQGEVLLAAFERPPDAPGNTVNSAVVIVTENVSAYPGLKKVEDYLGPLTELAIAKGLKPARDPEDIEIDNRASSSAPTSPSRLAPQKIPRKITTRSPCISPRSSCSRKARFFPSPSSPAAKTKSTI